MNRRLGLSIVAAAGSTLAAVLAFLALQGHRALTLEIDLEISGAQETVGEVWWTAGLRPLHPFDSTSFRAAPGRQRVSVRLPVEIDTLQIRPASAPGTRATIREIALRTPVATLRSWGGSRGFSGWRASEGVREFAAADGALGMLLAAKDAGFQVDDVRPLRDRARRLAHARIAVALGLLGGLLGTLLIAKLLPAGANAPGASSTPEERRPAPKGAWWLFAGTTAASAVALWLVGRALLRPAAPPVFTDVGEYSLVFVDHLGRRLSEKDGGLKLALDPHAFYRNAPDQKTSRFSIDSHGYRGGFDERDRRPRILVVGGSAAFGFGLDSDEQVFTARLGRRQPDWQVVNAAVVGHLSGQELSELVHRGDAVKPTAVVAYDGWNDLYVPLLAATRFPAAGLAAGFNWDVFHMAENRLRLLTLGGASEGPAPNRLEPVPDLARRIAATYQSNLATMNEVCAARGVRFLVVLQPWLATRRPPRTAVEDRVLKDWLSVGERAAPALYDALVDDTKRFLSGRGIAFVDLHASGPFVTASRPLFLDVVHMIPEGHDLLAEELLRPVGALLQLPAPASPANR